MAGRRVYGFVNTHLLVSLVLALILTFGWATFAYAQTSSDTQYGSPTASGGAAGHSAVAAISVLPSTGGPMIPFAVLGGLALCAAGVLAIRRTRNSAD